MDVNLVFRSEIVANFFFFSVEKSKVANRLKRALPKFCADRSGVKGGNGRPKLDQDVR